MDINEPSKIERLMTGYMREVYPKRKWAHDGPPIAEMPGAYVVDISTDFYTGHHYSEYTYDPGNADVVVTWYVPEYGSIRDIFPLADGKFDFTALMRYAEEHWEDPS